MATTFQGFVRSNGTPVVRALRCYDQTTGNLVATTNSAGDGSYSFTGLNASTNYYILAIDTASNFVGVFGPYLPTTESLDFNFSGANDSSSPLPVKLGYTGSIAQTSNLSLSLSFSTTQSVSAHPPVYPSQTATFNYTKPTVSNVKGYGGTSAQIRRINYTVSLATSLTYPPAQPSHFRAPTYTFKGYGGTSARLRKPLYTVSGIIEINPYGFLNATFNIPKNLKAYGATSAFLKQPKYTVTGFIESPQTIRSRALRGIRYAVDGTIQQPEQATARLKYLLPRKVKGYGATSARLKAPKYTVTGSILVDAQLLGYFRAPIFDVSGFIVSRDTATAQLRAIRYSTFYAHARLRSPLYTLQAENFTYSAHSLAYVMNIETGAITRYLNYGFDQVVNFNSKYYGIKADGIYELTGNTDAGTAIDAAIEFSPNDFSNPHLKRCNYLYIDSSDTTAASLKYDGTVCGPYVSEYIGRRTQIGRGGKGRYWGLLIENQNGGEMSINSVELEFLETRRI